MLPSLSAEQRQVIQSEGTPMAITDNRTGLCYVLFSVQMSELPDGFIAAAIPGLPLYGEGGSPAEAVVALAEAARALSKE